MLNDVIIRELLRIEREKRLWSPISLELPMDIIETLPPLEEKKEIIIQL